MAKYPFNRDVDPVRRLEFWDSMRDWFKEHGYYLFEFMDEDGKKYVYAMPTREYPDEPAMNFEDTPQDPFPYAFMGPARNYTHPERRPYSTTDYGLQGRVMFAQDVKGRHVVIKMVEGGSDEDKVVRLLKDQSCLVDPHSFPSVVPILDFLPYNDHWFLVMPRWEMSINKIHFFPTYHLAFQHLITLLEGLVFLHDLRIFHRDIFDRNIIVNHFSSLHPSSLQQHVYREFLKSRGVLRYAIMDFDMAMILDEKTYGSNPRLPIKRVMYGFGHPPYEVAHAYLDFDPFKYDVACLGIYFSGYYQGILKDVPLLAPLISGMVHPDINKRFTASEALAFARSILPTISSLGTVFNADNSRVAYFALDVWADLPESFIKEWDSHRYNVSSWTMRLKNYLYYDTTWGWHAMYYYRRTVRITTYLPRLLLRHILLHDSEHI